MDKIKIFYDGIDIKENNIIKGYTTNPSILKKYGKTKTYQELSHAMLRENRNNLPISFEVLSNGFEEMIQEAKEISSWSPDIYIKIPIINTSGEYNIDVIKELLYDNINVNITCVFTNEQINFIYQNINMLQGNVIISIFCGRIADTGVSPSVLCKYTSDLFSKRENTEILWASTREIYNIFEAIQSGCDIITIPETIYQKLHLINKDLTEYSKETVEQFVSDGSSFLL